MKEFCIKVLENYQTDLLKESRKVFHAKFLKDFLKKTPVSERTTENVSKGIPVELFGRNSQRNCGKIPKKPQKKIPSKFKKEFPKKSRKQFLI